MTEAQVSPSRRVSIAGKEYALDASFGTLRAVQEHFDRDIVQVLATVMDMRLDQIATLVAIAGGGRAEEIGQAIVDEMDIMNPGRDAPYFKLKAQLLAWLSVAISPKAEREKKSGEMDTILKGLSASPGETTSD